MRRTDLVVGATTLALGAALLIGGPWSGRAADAPRQVQNPHGKLDLECALCHGAEGWTPAHISRKFDHARVSGFALTGAHAGVGCAGCHKSLEFAPTPRACASCHTDPHFGELSADCERCHSTRSFIDRAALIRMHQLTRFPLVGGHAAIDCESCHPPAAQGHAKYVATSAECRSCHAPGTVPDHAGFSSDCASCHNTMAWRPTHFNHAGTGFALGCAHSGVSCQDAKCHGSPWVNLTSNACVSCHGTDPAYTASCPTHRSINASTRCNDCHNCVWGAANLQPASGYVHSRFPGGGEHDHSRFQCSSCHQTCTNYGNQCCSGSGCHGSCGGP